MDVIPVLDLLRGRAVHARGGNRTRYRVVQGVFGTGDDPIALATAFRDRLRCRSLYAADLDAIGPMDLHAARSTEYVARSEGSSTPRTPCA